jgi:uncharacterized NAD-dependent epimerase/dehydratase family protein
MRRLAILAEAAFDPQHAKTAVGVLRYSSDAVVAVIDSTRAGQDAADALGDPSGLGRGVPIVADLAATLPYKPDTLLIGIAPIGGRLPDEWRGVILAAITAGLDVVSGASASGTCAGRRKIWRCASAKAPRIARAATPSRSAAPTVTSAK